MYLEAKIIPSADGSGHYIAIEADCSNSVCVHIAYTILQQVAEAYSDNVPPHVQSALDCLSLCFDVYNRREVTDEEFIQGTTP